MMLEKDDVFMDEGGQSAKKAVVRQGPSKMRESEDGSCKHGGAALQSHRLTKTNDKAEWSNGFIKVCSGSHWKHKNSFIAQCAGSRFSPSIKKGWVDRIVCWNNGWRPQNVCCKKEKRFEPTINTFLFAESTMSFNNLQLKLSCSPVWNDSFK